jgi:lysophospholipase L1-like esterase
LSTRIGFALASSALCLLALAACSGTDSAGTGGAGGSSSSATGSGQSSNGSGNASASASGTGGATTGTSTSTSTGTGGSGTGGGSPGLASLGTLVVLGDSISDGGGQPPFYYNLLRTDLATKYGTIAYHNQAQSGSETDALVGQINSLPGTLAGPVAVTITSGGNDMKAAITQIVTGMDGPAKTAMSNQIKAALDLLLAPNKFGAGVDVHVYEGNIYDASDGAGDYSAGGCAFGSGLPTIPTDGFFMAWNQVISDQVAAHGQVLTDMHAYFYGHGYKSSPNWYAPDCTHPSTLGHDQLRRLFYQQITGEALP